MNLKNVLSTIQSKNKPEKREEVIDLKTEPATPMEEHCNFAFDASSVFEYIPLQNCVACGRVGCCVTCVNYRVSSPEYSDAQKASMQAEKQRTNKDLCLVPELISMLCGQNKRVFKAGSPLYPDGKPCPNWRCSIVEIKEGTFKGKKGWRER
jgi:hypothetical protein